MLDGVGVRRRVEDMTTETSPTPATSPDDGSDPFLWLEEVEGERALAWVRERNEHAEAALTGTRRFASTKSAILEVLDSADKIPGVDSIWDLIHTLARVPAGAFLAAATLSPDGQLGTGTLLAGAGVALASHGLKAGTRALLNTSPEPASNWVASVAEDTVVVGGLALALAHPWIALVVVLACSLAGALLVWLVWRTLWKGVRWLARAGGTVASGQPRTG